MIRNPVSEIFSLFARFYMIIPTKMALRPYIETLISIISKQWCPKSSYHNSSYYIENIVHLNHIKPRSLKFHIEPAVACGLCNHKSGPPVIIVPFCKDLARMEGTPQPNQIWLPVQRIETGSLDLKPQPLTIWPFLTPSLKQLFRARLMVNSFSSCCF